jgi:hypothetical protein
VYKKYKLDEQDDVQPVGLLAWLMVVAMHLARVVVSSTTKKLVYGDMLDAAPRPRRRPPRERHVDQRDGRRRELPQVQLEVYSKCPTE